MSRTSSSGKRDCSAAATFHARPFNTHNQYLHDHHPILGLLNQKFIHLSPLAVTRSVLRVFVLWNSCFTHLTLVKIFAVINFFSYSVFHVIRLSSFRSSKTNNHLLLIHKNWSVVDWLNNHTAWEELKRQNSRNDNSVFHLSGSPVFEACEHRE